MEAHKREYKYCIDHRVGKQESQLSVGSQAGTEKFVIGTSGWHPSKGDYSNRKRKTKPPSGGEGNDVLWPENDGKKIKKKWVIYKDSLSSMPSRKINETIQY